MSALRKWSRRVVTGLRHPTYGVRRLGLLAYELTHPNEPWIASGAVRYCEQHLPKSARALEWGSGRSTLWFAERVASLTSIEHDSGWFEKMSPRVAQHANVDYRLITLDHPLTAPTLRTYDPQPRYVGVIDDFEDSSLGLVVVDGHYRQACVRAAIPKLARGGLLLIDNWDRTSREEWGVPPELELLHLSSNAMTHTAIWTKP